MVTIGKKVYVATDVVFMTHDGSLSWMSRALGYTDKRKDKIDRIVVKDNCFIGAKTIIMQNVTIGINCIVGRGAIVTKDVPDNSVVAGTSKGCLYYGAIFREIKGMQRLYLLVAI